MDILCNDDDDERVSCSMAARLFPICERIRIIHGVL